MDTTQHDRIALRQTLERFLDCPTAEHGEQLRAQCAAWQSRWITEHAGMAAPAPAKQALPVKAAPRLGDEDRAVLARLAGGWRATAADAPRWVWFEDRELITMVEGPDGVEYLELTDLGRAAAGV